MRCLVTGAAGFIGHNLVAALLEEGHEVVGVDNFLTGVRDRVEKKDNYLFLEGSVQELEYEAEQMKLNLDFDAVFHLAALPRVPISFEKPRDSLENNVVSTIAALEIARKSNPKSNRPCVFVYSSSSSIYGDQEEMPLVDFEEQAQPQSPYALSKYMGEELCAQYLKSFDIPAVCLRYFNVYGPGMTQGGYATAIRTFLDQAKKGEALTVTGDGLQERDFTHVSDVVRANILAAEKMIEETASAEDVSERRVIGPMNIGAGSPQVILNVAKAISENVTHIEARREPKKTHAYIDYIKEILGWEPKMPFDEGLKQLIENNL